MMPKGIFYADLRLANYLYFEVPFIDANIFLQFYHFSNDDLGEIHKLTVLMENGEVVL